MTIPNRDIIVIAHDIRSTHNVGSLFRTCEGFNVQHLYLTGYTPYPVLSTHDPRLPHIARKLTEQIHKTALDTEHMIRWSHMDDVIACITQLHTEGYTVVALEQAANSIALPEYQPPQKIALLLGREVEGIDPSLLTLCDHILEIPMLGHKESFNVVQAAAIALYGLRFS